MKMFWFVVCWLNFVLFVVLCVWGQCCLTISHCFWLKAVASHHSVCEWFYVEFNDFVCFVCL